VCGCSPTSCAAQGANCDQIADGCGGTLYCGACSGTETCGGGGTPHVCGKIYPPGYIGCFADQDVRDLPSFMGSNFTSQSCRAQCGGFGFAYAGTQYYGECWCGNAYGSYGSSNGCDTPCSADPSEICGGAYANSVYSTS
jgi:hypothetical protein